MLPNRKRLPWIKHSLGWLPRNGQNLSLLIERGIILQGSRRMSTTHFSLVQSITVITLWTCTRKKTGNVELFLLFMQEEQSSKNHWNASYHRFIELFHRISTFESILVDTFASGLGIKWAISLFYLTHSRSLRHGNSNRARLPKEKKLWREQYPNTIRSIWACLITKRTIRNPVPYRYNYHWGRLLKNICPRNLHRGKRRNINSRLTKLH